ncbi:MAG: sensor histidine kinase [Sarcina sp.]
MGTKWTESKSLISIIIGWFKNYNLQVRSIENFIMIIFLLGVPVLITILTDGKEINNHHVKYNLAIADKNLYMEERLKAQANEISGQVFKKLPYLEKLREEKIFDETKVALEDIQGLQDIGVVIFDTNTKVAYSNKSWFYDLQFKFNSSEEIITALESEDKILAKQYKEENENGITHNNGFEEIYFTRIEVFEGEITSITILFTISLISLIIVCIIGLKKLYMIKSLGPKLYRDSLRWGYLYKIKNATGTFMKRNLIFNEILSDKVVWIIISFVVLALIGVSVVDNLAIEGMFEINDELTLSILFKVLIIFSAPIALIIHFLMKILYRYEAIEFLTENLKSIERGNFDIEVRYDDDPQIRKLSKGINDIRRGYKTAIEEALRSEKMKTELISNVSHDLKTPLTSIINYVNIIQRDDITQEEREEYIDILEHKSIRLKELIEDLFEVSKMNSGKIKLDKYDIDIVQLLHQCIAELEDFNAEKNMEFKIKGIEELEVNLDGMRMARVFQNLGTNALKYGLDNTRVYINVQDKGDDIEISFKNISEYELDFDAKDIVERFYRGDKSRNSDIEGSGLGLAITKSIVELHDGKFRVECEGDLFKAYIIIPK